VSSVFSDEEDFGYQACVTTPDGMPSFLAGGDGEELHVYHITGERKPTPTSRIPLPHSVSALAADNFIFCGGQNGKVSLLDPMLRSPEPVHVFTAHMGRVTSLACLDNLLVTSGIVR
jgi:WD40 repeat protein